MDTSSGDAMDWRIDTPPKVIHASTEPFDCKSHSGAKRRFADIADGSESTTRGKRWAQTQNTNVDTGNNTTWQQNIRCGIRLLMSFLGCGSPESASPRRQHRRSSSIFRQNPAVNGRPSITYISPPRSRPRPLTIGTAEYNRKHLLDERAVVVKAHGQRKYSDDPNANSSDPTKNPLCLITGALPDGELPPLVLDDLCLCDKPSHPPNVEHLESGAADPCSYAQYEKLQMSGALTNGEQPPADFDKDCIITPEPAPLWSPRSMKVRSIPGSYPVSPLQYKSHASSAQPFVPSQIDPNLPAGHRNLAPAVRPLPGTFPESSPQNQASAADASQFVPDVVDPRLLVRIRHPEAGGEIAKYNDWNGTRSDASDLSDVAIMDESGSATSEDNGDLRTHASKNWYDAVLFEVDPAIDEYKTSIVRQIQAAREVVMEPIELGMAGIDPDIIMATTNVDINSMNQTVDTESTDLKSLTTSIDPPTSIAGHEEVAIPSTPTPMLSTPALPPMSEEAAEQAISPPPSPCPMPKCAHAPMNNRTLPMTGSSELNQIRTPFLEESRIASDAGLNESAPTRSPLLEEPAVFLDPGLSESTVTRSLSLEQPAMLAHAGLDGLPLTRSPLSRIAPNQASMFPPIRQSKDKTPKRGILMRKIQYESPPHRQRLTFFNQIFSSHRVSKPRPSLHLTSPRTPLEKKTVGFYSSPKTGRPVIGVKRFTIGESMSHPSPISSHDDSTLSTLSSLDSIDSNEELHLGDPTSSEQAEIDAQLFQEATAYMVNQSAFTVQPSNQHGSSPLSTVMDSGSLLMQPGGQPESSSAYSDEKPNNIPPQDGQQESSPASNKDKPASLPAPPCDQADSLHPQDNPQGSSPNSNSKESGSLPLQDDPHGSSPVPTTKEPDSLPVQPLDPKDDDILVDTPKKASRPEPQTPPVNLSSKLESLNLSGRRSSDRQRNREEEAQRLQVEREELAAKEKARKDKEDAEVRAQLEREAEEENRRSGARRMPREKVIQPLSAEWESKLSAALGRRMNDEIAISSAGVPITRRAIGKVLPQPGTGDDPAGWLNDEIIAGYLQAIADYGNGPGHRRGNTPKVHAFSTYFYTKLKSAGYDAVIRWAKRAKIGGKDLEKVEWVFVPVNVGGNHWTMLAVSPVRKTIEYFDSLHGSSERPIETIKVWLKGELKSAWKEDEWRVLEDERYVGRGKGPTQNNGSDCGVFSLTTAKMITLKVDPMHITPSDMPLQRKRLVAELIHGSFSGEFEPHVVFA